MIEIILLSFGFFCMGYVTSRPNIWILSLAGISWIITSISVYVIKKTPLIPSFPAEHTLTMKINDLILVSIGFLIFYIIPFGIGYYIGKVVNNVEKYQRK